MPSSARHRVTWSATGSSSVCSPAAQRRISSAESRRRLSVKVMTSMAACPLIANLPAASGIGGPVATSPYGVPGGTDLSPGDRPGRGRPVPSGRDRPPDGLAPPQYSAGPLVDREVDHGPVDRDGADSLIPGGLERRHDLLGPVPLRSRGGEGVVDEADLVGMDTELAAVAELADGPGRLPA